MIARKSAIVIAGKLSSAFMGYIGLLLIIRYLGPSTMGYIAFALSFVATFNFVTDLGFIAGHMKVLNYGKNLKKYIGTYAFIRASLTLAMALLVFGGIFAWKNLFHKGFTDATSENVICIFVLYYVILNLTSIITGTFDARLETEKSQFSQLVESMVKLPLICVVIFLKLDIMMLALTYVAGIAAVGIVALYFFRGYEIEPPDRESLKLYWHFAAPFLVLAIIGTIWTNADKLILGYFWTANDVGLYYGVQSVTNFLYMFSIAIGSVLLPAFASEFARKNHKRVRAMIHEAERYIAMAIIPAVIFILIFAEPIVRIILSDSYLPAVTALRLLSIFVLITTLTSPYSQAILASRDIWKIVVINSSFIVLYVLFEVYFVPRWFWFFKPLGMGITGAATAWVLYIFIGATVTRLQAKAIVGTMANYRLVKQVFAGFILFCAFFLLSPHVDIARWYQLLAMAALCLSTYVGILTVVGEFGRNEIKTIRTILKI